jgi:hypothetical protein
MVAISLSATCIRETWTVNSPSQALTLFIDPCLTDSGLKNKRTTGVIPVVHVRRSYTIELLALATGIGFNSGEKVNPHHDLTVMSGHLRVPCLPDCLLL